MERRIKNRINTRVALEARARGRTFSTQLYDLSPTGCRVDCSTLAFARGDRIVFRFNDHVKITGRVAWCRAGTAGVRFCSELPEEITRHFRGEPTSALSEYRPTDWFLL